LNNGRYPCHFLLPCAPSFAGLVSPTTVRDLFPGGGRGSRRSNFWRTGPVRAVSPLPRSTSYRRRHKRWALPSRTSPATASQISWRVVALDPIPTTLPASLPSPIPAPARLAPARLLIQVSAPMGGLSQQQTSTTTATPILSRPPGEAMPWLLETRCLSIWEME